MSTEAELTGTVKQIAWATDIREQKIAAVRARRDDPKSRHFWHTYNVTMRMMKSWTQAETWINRRTWDADEFASFLIYELERTGQLEAFIAKAKAIDAAKYSPLAANVYAQPDYQTRQARIYDNPDYDTEEYDY